MGIHDQMQVQGKTTWICSGRREGHRERKLPNQPGKVAIKVCNTEETNFTCAISVRHLKIKPGEKKNIH
jgi:hypothetical protein